ncbi:MAG: hypothetical protein KGI09_07930, partial [Thaumarchaeota archaeon]|nr:hypothetical protein [Nitrososphaerota archaeon]
QLKFQEYDPYEPIPNYSRWKVKYETDPKYGTKHYWLDTEIEPVPTIEDIFNPEYSIKGIKGTWNNKIKVSDKKGKVRIKTEKIDIREILKTALNLEKRFQNRIRSENLPQIFPRTRDKAIKWKEMLDKIDHFEQVRREIGSDVIISSSPVNENDQARKRFERYMEKGKAEMVRAYTAAERHLNEAQKIYKKYGLHLQYSQKSLKDY